MGVLDHTPTTALKIVSQTALGWMTALVLFFHVWTPEWDILAIWLAYLLGKTFDATRQFVQKRKTYVTDGPDADRAGLTVEEECPPIASGSILRPSNPLPSVSSPTGMARDG